jgi:hypothetical protein
MPVLVRTLTAPSREDLAGLVKSESAKGWAPIGNPAPLHVGGQPQPDRAKWMQFIRRLDGSSSG